MRTQKTMAHQHQHQHQSAGGSGSGSGSDHRPDGNRMFVTHLSMGDESVQGGDRTRLLGQVDDDSDEHTASQSAFLLHFIKSSGPPHVITLCLIVALALGSTIGVVPAVVGDRYARLHHGYTGKQCAELAKEDRPHECLMGNEDAQNSAAISGFISNTLTFTTSSLMGSISDEKGRRGDWIQSFDMSLFRHILITCLLGTQLLSNRVDLTRDCPESTCATQFGSIATVREHGSIHVLCISCSFGPSELVSSSVVGIV